MAQSAKIYTNALVGFLKGDFKWLLSGGSSFKVALMGAGFTPDQDTQDFWDDISANEIAAGNGYTAGGAALATLDPTVDLASNEVRLDATDSVWANATLSAYYAVIYQSTGTPGTSRLIGYQFFDGVKSSTNADFKVTWDANGIFYVTAL